MNMQRLVTLTTAMNLILCFMQATSTVVIQLCRLLNLFHCFAVTVRRHVQSGGHRDRDLDRMFRMRENATNLNPRCRY